MMSKISSKWHLSSSTLKVEFLKVWKFVCPELEICCQASFKVKVYSSDQLILLYRISETNEKPIKNWRFFGVSFSWCLASTQRNCRRPRKLLFEQRLYESLAAGGKPSTRFPPGRLVELYRYDKNSSKHQTRIKIHIYEYVEKISRIRPNSKASREKPLPQKHPTEIIAMQTM